MSLGYIFRKSLFYLEENVKRLILSLLSLLSLSVASTLAFAADTETKQCADAQNSSECWGIPGCHWVSKGFGVGCWPDNPARDLNYSCQVPGFLNFAIQTAPAGQSVLHVNQLSYGLIHGPATTLAHSLGASPAPGSGVQSLVLDHDQTGKNSIATFEFTDGSTKTVDLGEVQISLRDDYYTNNGVTYAAKTLSVTSNMKSILNVPAQANLCQSEEPLSKATNFNVLE